MINRIAHYADVLTSVTDGCRTHQLTSSGGPAGLGVDPNDFFRDSWVLAQ